MSKKNSGVSLSKYLWQYLNLCWVVRHLTWQPKPLIESCNISLPVCQVSCQEISRNSPSTRWIFYPECWYRQSPLLHNPEIINLIQWDPKGFLTDQLILHTGLIHSQYLRHYCRLWTWNSSFIFVLPWGLHLMEQRKPLYFYREPPLQCQVRLGTYL